MSASLPSTPTQRSLARRAAGLLVFTALLIVGAALYLLYARGAFETTQRLVLVADNAEGVVVGMDLTFSGFPIGRVRSVGLGPDGMARIDVDVPTKDAHWLRQSSVFTLERGLVGGTNIRAHTGILSDPPLPPGAVRQVLRGDATADIPRLVSTARELLDNLNRLSSPEGALGATLAQLQQITERINGPGGALGVALGGDQQARQVRATLARVDAMLAKADTQLFGAQGAVPEAQASLGQLHALLSEARGSLGKLNAVLVEAQAVGANARVATQDLGTLRAEVEASLRKVEHLLNEVNRKWPFSGRSEVKLP